MPLEEYRHKRDFTVTPEPAGEPASGPGAVPGPGAVAGAGAVAGPGGELTFVVHKHAARALHYDLRLEMGGVLASWAVPKGPSLDTADKHLAVHVEDHPIEYGAFEGVIPAGEYGGGTVMIWDRGTYSPVGDPRSMVEKGHLKLVLSGQKLVGAWALVRMKSRPGDKRENWLLIKERDEHVRPRAEYDVLAQRPESAATGRSMEEIAAEGRLYEGPRAGDAAGPEPAAGTAAGVPAGTASATPGRGAVAGPMPVDAPFQLATLAHDAPDGPEWIHEVKYDGYRLRLVLDRGRARVRTRSGADWTDRFGPVASAAEALPAASALIDGEAVVFGEDGRSDFGLLQEALAAKRPGHIDFAAFDLLYLDGFDLRGEPLLRRKELLRSLLEAAPARGPLRFVEHFAGGGPSFHASSCELLLEGSVSKRGDRPWVPGRSRDWLKAKCLARQEFVVGGWTDPAGSRAGFGALLLGVHDATGALRYAGRVGTGFTERSLADLRERLEALASDSPPFADPPRSLAVHWVRPELTAEVRFREWTRDGVVRQPSFVGLREDVDTTTVTREDAPAPDGHARPASAPVRIAGVAISNPAKVLDPAGLTKGDLARYYERVAPAMLPHLAGRLITAVRCPHGPGGGPGECFYQKHPESRGWPKALHVVAVRDNDVTLDYFYADDPEGLLSLVQLGVLEIHVWNSLASDYDRPDRLVFDLDPGEGVAFGEVAAAARTLRDALGAFGLAAYPKTTGGHGVHVVVPVEPDLGYDDAREWAHALVERLAKHDPSMFTAKMAKVTRPGRVFIDYLRNAHGATAVCAFSTRARPGGAVSVPVSWAELEAGLDPPAFTIRSVPERLERLGSDPWQGYEAGRRPLAPALFAALGIEPPAEAAPKKRRARPSGRR